MRHALAVLFLSTATRAADIGIEVPCTVVDATGKPVAAEVYLVKNTPPSATFDHATAAADGRVAFGKDLIGRLWKDQTYPQIIALDAAGRFGAVRLVYPGLDDPPYTIKLAAVSEVSGRVVGTDGKPVGGATVAASAVEMQVDGFDFPDELQLPVEVRDRYRATTGADGRFILRGVPPARVRAAVSAPGFATLAFDWDPKRATDLTLPRGVAVSGRVGGAEAASRTLALGDEEPRFDRKPKEPVVARMRQFAVTAADGSFRFAGVPAGKHPLAEDGKPKRTTYLDERTVDTDGGRDVALGDWPLKPMRKLRGRVLDEAGQGVAGVAVSLVRFKESSFGRQAIATDADTVSGPDGGFSGYVRPDLIVGAQHGFRLPEGYAVTESRDAVAGDPPAEELPPLRVAKAAAVVVRVVDAAGRPVAGARVETAGANFAAGGRVKRVTGPDGTLTLYFGRKGESTSLRALTADAASLPQSFHSGEATEPVTLQVSPDYAFRIAGRVVDAAGQPLAGVVVVVSRMVMYGSKSDPRTAGSGGDYGKVRTDADGRFVGGPYASGDRFHVRIRVAGAKPVQSADVVAEAGKTHDFGTLAVVRFDGVVRGHVVEGSGKPVAGAKVVNGGDGRGRIVTASGADGRFEIAELVSGPAQVVAFADGFRPGIVRADSSKPDAVVLTLRRTGEPDATTPAGIDDAAVKRSARVVFDRVWEWAEGRSPEVDKLLLEYLARIDPAEATKRRGKPPETSLDELADDDPVAALARLAAGEPRLAIRELKRLAERYADTDPAKALRFVSELVAKARGGDPRYRPFDQGNAALLLAKLGRKDAGRQLVDEAASGAEKLPTAEWDGYVRGHVASRLAAFDLPRALRLLEAEKNAFNRDRYLGMMAGCLIDTDVVAAGERLAAMGDEFQRSRVAAPCAARLARTDPDAAVRFAEKYGAGTSYAAIGIAWSALAVKDRAAAHRLVERAFRKIHERGAKELGFNSTGAGWGETAAQVAVIARHLDYPDRAALVAHVVAERPTEGEVIGQDRVVAGHAAMALALADIDAAAARSLLDVAEAHSEMIAGNVGHRQREYLGAWALLDPGRAVGMLADAFAKRKARGKKLEFYDDIIVTLNLMTATPPERGRLIAKRLGEGWPTGEID